MTDIEDIRARKLEEMKSRMASQQEEADSQAKMEQQLSALLNNILTPEAKARLSNVKLVNYEKYLQVAQGIIMMARQGKLPGKINEDQLKALLAQVTPPKKEFNITRKGSK
ncbi:MAG: DNA-binding protein [Candidatus Iainarchaeum archaeon]|uniref:DNA-binding protein n=1 Tax=Candidatus Iainarchaeum sp. TaxID=3101447 RepID=A0A7T9DK51_9ARCH|nr:MAG: DNA-binding protein [Candidatus Diapherotrites archaeon]